MPNAFINNVVKDTDAKRSEAEHTFKKIEENAKKSGATNPYAVATAAVEKIYGYKPKG